MPAPNCTYLAEGEQLAQHRLHLLPQRVGAAGQRQACKQAVDDLQGASGAESAVENPECMWSGAACG